MTDFKFYQIPRADLLLSSQQPSAKKLSHQPMAGARSSQLLCLLLKKELGKIHFREILHPRQIQFFVTCIWCLFSIYDFNRKSVH
ncbi:MAG: hypothetical protein CMJ77_08265 [Planctomycetaceae bacterium]|nr:hypothetical protein [Planctomycetaceae bacterium]